MAHDDLELVMRGLAAALKSPKPDFATVNALYHPEHVFVPVMARKLGEAEAKGARGYRAWLEDVTSATALEQDLEGAVDIGRGLVLAVATTRFEGASSGAGGEQRIWFLVAVADGKIIRTEAFFDPGEALAAAGPME